MVTRAEPAFDLLECGLRAALAEVARQEHATGVKVPPALVRSIVVATLSATTPTTFVDVIGLWRSAAELGDDIHEDPGKIRQWRLRNSIPSSAWERVVASARRRGFEQVTYHLLAKLAAGEGKLNRRPKRRRCAAQMPLVVA